MEMQLSRQAKSPLFKQIFTSISDQIESGLLTPDSALPSVRGLAEDLGVSLMTVVRAYRLLEDQGYIVSHPGKGSFVSRAFSKSRAESMCKDAWAWQTQIHSYIPRAQFWNRNKTWTSDSMLHLSCAYVHRSLMPMENIAHKLLEAATRDTTMLYDYSPIQGDLEVRACVSTYFKTLGLSISPTEMIITNGTQQGITLVAETFLGPGDVVVMESPTFMVAIDAFRKRGAQIVTLPVDQDGMMTSRLAELCEHHHPKLIYTMPTYHNPTGAVMSLARRYELLEIAQAFNCIVVEDDPWSELSYVEQRLPALKALDQEGRVLHLKGFSKFLLPGCRLGVLSAEGVLLKLLIACKATADLGSPLPSQRLIQPLLQPCFISKYLKSLNKILLDRRTLSLEILERYMPKGVKWTVPEGGPNIWITLPKKLDTDLLLERTAMENVTFLPGASCYAADFQRHHLRISFSFLSKEDLEKALKTLCELTQEGWA